MTEHDSTILAASKLCANSQSEVITRTISIYALEFSESTAKKHREFLERYAQG
jgi:hypothetical protein